MRSKLPWRNPVLRSITPSHTIERTWPIEPQLPLTLCLLLRAHVSRAGCTRPRLPRKKARSLVSFLSKHALPVTYLPAARRGSALTRLSRSTASQGWRTSEDAASRLACSGSANDPKTFEHQADIIFFTVYLTYTQSICNVLLYYNVTENFIHDYFLPQY